MISDQILGGELRPETAISSRLLGHFRPPLPTVPSEIVELCQVKRTHSKVSSLWTCCNGGRTRHALQTICICHFLIFKTLWKFPIARSSSMNDWNNDILKNFRIAISVVEID